MNQSVSCTDTPSFGTVMVSFNFYGKNVDICFNSKKHSNKNHMIEKKKKKKRNFPEINSRTSLSTSNDSFLHQFS